MMTIPQQVKEKVQAIDSQAEVILFGSRARGDARVDSDWDFLILLSRKLDIAEKDLIRNGIYTIELEVEQIITPMLREKQWWKMFKLSHFHQNVQQDGIHIT